MFEGKRVLTIDDSPTIRHFLRSILESQGARVEEACTGQEGINKCAGNHGFYLILLDLMLPDMDGLQVLKYLREKDSDTAIAMLTGAGGIKSAIEAVRQGADAYVEKQDLIASGDFTGFIYALEQAVKQRAGIVAQLQLQQIKTDFYSMVTHDLRNPASSILVMLEMLQQSQLSAFTTDQLELLDLLQQSAQRLMELIDNYLDFAKIDAGYLRLEWNETNLRELVAHRAHLAELQARVRKQTLLLDLPPEAVLAHVDAERLEQAFDNLLSNAVKYAPEGGQILVKLSVESNCAVFSVNNTGAGISAEQLPTLFTKYHRVPGEAARGIRGTGLGLLIVKEIVEAHGGEVTATSERQTGQGTTFILKIPLHPAQPQPQPE